jgi:starch synthase (maltosyl-transferring)
MRERGEPSGPIIYNLFPLLVGPIRAWAEHLPRIREMGFDYVYVNPFHLAGSSGSIYAIKDATLLDPRFKNAPDDGDEAIQAFADQARRDGLTVMVDLVVNHAARDSVLLERHPEFFARDRDGGLVTPFATDPLAESNKVFWHDLAEFNYDDPVIRARLIDHWDAYVARFQRLEITAFRCDAAHLVPNEVWRELILRAKARHADCVFIGETLGCTLDRADEIARLGFAYIMNNFNYANFEELPVLVEYERLRRLAPSIAFPESHDTERLAAQFDARDPARVSRELISRYMLSAFFSTGVMMPIGYEWGYRKKIDVAKTSPADREHSGVDVSAEIAEINRLRRMLTPLNVEGEQKRLSRRGADVLALLRGDDAELERSRFATLTVANISGRPTCLAGAELLKKVGRFEGFVDHTPRQNAWNLSREAEFTLAPGEVRILSAARADIGAGGSSLEVAS